MTPQRPSHPTPNVRDDREPPLLWVRDKREHRFDLPDNAMPGACDRLARRAMSHSRTDARGIYLSIYDRDFDTINRCFSSIRRNRRSEIMAASYSYSVILEPQEGGGFTVLV